ncbi:hypothetical protein BGZ95_002502 [Linnemannia exigua]|uniref:Uncharacterized protein n=1 Tax=Linnemannia exigua TaxID=604196 RepID=A0AAD4H4A0_9FUNG|nr:hypothetical protein BGZ95_002502 [Linnemannia exigua]
MKNTVVSLTIVLGLLVVANNAAPIARRDDDAASCPATLRGPSGNAYFAFSTNLGIQTAKEACASCYGGSLANVGAADLQFLGKNLESSSWIKAWNGDDYASSCLTIQPKAGAQPGVGVDATCASQMWPLCTASAEQAEWLQRTQEQEEQEQEQSGETIVTLAVPYVEKNAPAAALEPTKVDAEVAALVPDGTSPIVPTVTCPKKPDGSYQTDDSCITPAEEAAVVVVVEEPINVVDDAAKTPVPDSTTPGPDAPAVADAVLELPTKVDAEVNAALEAVPDSTGPDGPCVTCPGNGVVAAAEVVVEEPTHVVEEAKAQEVVVPDSTNPAGPCVTCPGNGIDSVADVVIEEPTKVVAEVNAEVVVPDTTRPMEPAVTCPRRPEGQYEAEGACIQSEEVPAAVVVEEPTKVEAEVINAIVPDSTGPSTSVAEVAPPTAEVAPATPATAFEVVDPLTFEKEKVQAAFEADAGACSSQLALGEQDPLVNEYVIETLSETASCSEARQEALTADVQDRVAHYEAAQAKAQDQAQAPLQA